MLLTPSQEIKHFINGKFQDSGSGKLFNAVDPTTGQIYAEVYEAGRKLAMISLIVNRR